MIKYAKSIPLFCVMCYALAYFFYRGTYEMFHIFHFMVLRSHGCDSFARGVGHTLLLGCSIALLYAGFYHYIKRGRWLLGISLSYAGSLITYWLSVYGLPFIDLRPYKFTLEQPYVVLLSISLLCFVLFVLRNYDVCRRWFRVKCKWAWEVFRRNF